MGREHVHWGLEALRIARDWRPDVVVAAIGGRMDGVVLAAALRARAETAATRVLLVSADETGGTLARAGAVGIAALLKTPVAVAELVRALSGADGEPLTQHAAERRRRGRSA